jgi:hypothetical protein
MVLFGVDFGRVFLGWVTLNNAVREAANFAAINPTAWTSPGSPTAQAEFNRLINAESDEINCTLPTTLPDPTFPAGTDLGSPAVVSITCEFSLITPLIGSILGSPLDVTAAASFPIRSGAISGVPTTGGTLPTPGPTPDPWPEPSATDEPDPTPTLEPTCEIPNLVQGSIYTDDAADIWIGAGFDLNNLIFDPAVTDTTHYDIKDQSLAAGSTVLCSTSMTVHARRQ